MLGAVSVSVWAAVGFKLDQFKLEVELEDGCSPTHVYQVLK